MLKFYTSTIAAATLLASASLSHAAPPVHPAYLHALEDLKLAENAIASRGGDPAMHVHDRYAIQQIEAAQTVIYQVAPQEKKNVHTLPQSDANAPAAAGKLHDALDYLAKARSDLNEPDSDAQFNEAKRRVLILVSAAEGQVNMAISDYEHHK